MKATTRRGAGAAAAEAVPAVKTNKKRKDGGGFLRGCGGSKSVWVAAGNLSSTATKPLTKSWRGMMVAAKPASSEAKTAMAAAPVSQDAEQATSVGALLRQLDELERGVRALGVRYREYSGDLGSAQARRCSGRHPAPPPRRHRTSESEVFGGSAYEAAAGRGRLEEQSVAVVTEAEDPLGEFRRSMAEMVVENGITGGAELRELLQRFLSLNSPRHHHLILLAFADVWEELFAGSGEPLPRPHTSSSKQKPLPCSTRSSELGS